jgi:TolA-binding protein
LIESLSRENAILKSQFAEAVSVASKFQAISDTNTELASKVHLLESANAELSQRVQVLGTMNEDLRSRAATQTDSQLRPSEADVGQLRGQLDESGGQSEQIKRLRAGEAALDTAELKLVNRTNEMKSVLSAASKHFSIPVFDADSLIAQLLKKPPLVEAVSPATDDRRLKRKFGRLRNQLRRSER